MSDSHMHLNPRNHLQYGMQSDQRNHHHTHYGFQFDGLNFGEGSCGEIEHTSHMSENIGALFLSDEFSDVTFIVEGERIPAHRVIIAAQSKVFKAMLFGGMKESNQEESVIDDCSLFAFRSLLKYVYTARLSLVAIKEEQVLEILGLAHKYDFDRLQNAVADYLKAILTTKNLCHIFNISQLYLLKDLTEYCLVFADRNASEVLNTPGFLQLSMSAVVQLISRDSFCAPEIDIFNAIKEWTKSHPDVPQSTTTQALMKCLRLPLIGQVDLLTVVRPTGLLDPETLLDAIAEQSQKKTFDLTHRGFITPNSNIATAQLGATVTCGDLPNSLLGGEISMPADPDRCLTKHHIGDEEGIVVQLRNPYIINRINMWLWDREPRMYSYIVEVSMDGRDYARILDYSKFLCRSRQVLFFQARPVRFIRIIGTHNTHNNKVFHLFNIEALYSTEHFEVVEVDTASGIVVADQNVATIDKNALVLEGVSRCRNALLNGEVQGYDWDNGYTCHQLGSGAITVQLPQPYIISSMRLLLWDCDDRYYSYYIEVSVNQTNWKRVVDKTNEQCRSWQLLEFEPEPVIFIRIVGTYNSANEVFHCVHFECPADPRTEMLINNRMEDNE